MNRKSFRDSDLSSSHLLFSEAEDAFFTRILHNDRNVLQRLSPERHKVKYEVTNGLHSKLLINFIILKLLI